MKKSRECLNCPRCGYELGGLVGTWQESCPLVGVCSECGLRFPWRLIFDIARHDVAWFFEHQRWGGVWHAASRVLLSAIRTLWWVVSLSLWFKVSIERRVVLRRAAAWLLVTLGGMHMLGVLLNEAREILWTGTSRYLMLASPNGLFADGGFGELASKLARDLFWPLFSTGYNDDELRFSTNYWSHQVVAAVCMHAMVFALMFVLPTTRRLAKVHTRHVVRAGIYGLAFLVWIAGVRVLRNGYAVIDMAVGALGAGTTARGVGWYYDNEMSVWGSGVFAYIPMHLDAFPPVVLYVLTLGWVAAWWYMTMRYGWRLSRAWLVWGVLMVPALLVWYMSSVMVRIFQGSV